MVGPGTTAVDQPNLSFRFAQFDVDTLNDFYKYKKFLLKQTKFFYELEKNYYDEFLRGILIFHQDIISSTKVFNYQPLRIFILGRYFKNFPNFYKKQLQITNQTNQKFFFLIQHQYKKIYKKFLETKENCLVCPNIQEENFFSFLNAFLVQHNVQKVLLETGLRFFDFVFPYLEKEDFIYLVEKQNCLKQYKKEISKEYLFWDKTQYNLVLQDMIHLEDLNIYSLRKV